MADKVIIVGAGAVARYVITTSQVGREFEVLGLIDTFGNPDIWNTEVNGVPVLGALDKLPQDTSSCKLILAVSNREQKKVLAQTLASRGFAFRNAIHPTAIIAPSVELGTGNVINARVVIESNAKIGNHTIVHAGCVVEHDNVLEDYVNLAPGVVAAGRVTFQEGATVYTGASLIPGVTIGEYATVGAGSVVLRDIPAHTTAVGVPAHLLSVQPKSR